LHIISVLGRCWSNGVPSGKRTMKKTLGSSMLVSKMGMGLSVKDTLCAPKDTKDEEKDASTEVTMVDDKKIKQIRRKNQN